jgi:hypothetical protein
MHIARTGTLQQTVTEPSQRIGLDEALHDERSRHHRFNASVQPRRTRRGGDIYYRYGVDIVKYTRIKRMTEIILKMKLFWYFGAPAAGTARGSAPARVTRRRAAQDTDMSPAPFIGGRRGGIETKFRLRAVPHLNKQV